MKYIRYVSDLHLDFDASRQLGLWVPPPMEGDDDTVLIIAGDLWISDYPVVRPVEDGEVWLQRVARQFKYVVFVLGNHDYWGSCFQEINASIRDTMRVKKLDNCFLLGDGNFTVTLDDVKFVGATLWTDFNKGDPNSLRSASYRMNDYRRISSSHNGEGMLSAQTVYEAHKLEVEGVFHHAVPDFEDQWVIVVTHMAPSVKSIDGRYLHAGDMNYWYYSDLEDRVKASSAHLWFHGHIHNSKSYQLGNTHVLTNPRGYAGYEVNYEWNEKARVELVDYSEERKAA